MDPCSLNTHTHPLNSGLNIKEECTEQNKKIKEIVGKSLKEQDLPKVLHRLSDPCLRNKQKFNLDFRETYKASIALAHRLHKECTQFFPKGKCSADQKIIPLTCDQYSFLHCLLKKKFRELFLFTHDEEQYRLISHLGYIIITGAYKESDLFPEESYRFGINKPEEQDWYINDILQNLVSFFDVSDEMLPEIFVQKLFTLFHENVIEKKTTDLRFNTGKIVFPSGEIRSFDMFVKDFVDAYPPSFLMKDMKDLEMENSSFISEFYRIFDRKKPEAKNTDLITTIFSAIPQEMQICLFNRIFLRSAVHKEEAENYLKLKFLELVFLLLNHDGFGIHTKKKRLKEGDLLETYREYTFDENMGCTHIFVTYDIVPVKNDNQEKYSYEAGFRPAQITQSTELNGNTKKIFYPAGIKATHQYLLNWNVPPAFTDLFATSSESKLFLFISGLKMLSSLENNELFQIDSSGVITKQSGSSWLNWFSYSTEIPKEEVINETLQTLLLFLQMGARAHKEYETRIKFLEPESKKISFLSMQLRAYLQKSLEGLKKFQTTISSPCSKTTTETLLTNSFELIEKTMEGLKKIPDSIKCDLERQRTLIEWFTSGLVESTDPREFDWKVYRYQSFLTQLRTVTKQFFIDQWGSEKTEKVFREIENTKDEIEKSEVEEFIIHLFFKVDLDIKEINKFTQEYLAELRTTYTTHFIQFLRDLAKKSENSNIENFGIYPGFCELYRDLFYTLSEFFFTGVRLENESLQLVKKFNIIGAMSRDASEFISRGTGKSNSSISGIEDLSQHLYAAPWSAKAPILSQLANSFKGVSNVLLDPVLNGNLPQYLKTIEIREKDQVTRIKLVTFGSPTTGDAISPEFIGWMRSYKKKSKSHLSIVLQDMRPKYILGETGRINAIVATGESKEFKNTLYILVVSKNSIFYFQQGIYEFQSEVTQYKKELYNEFFTVDKSVSGNYISAPLMEKIGREKLSQDVRNIIEVIHRYLFFNKPNLSQKERIIFNDLFQDFFTLYILFVLKPDSFNISCKDAIDRAADSIARLWAHLGIVNDLDSNKYFRKIFEIFLLSRALMVRKRKPIGERIERSVQAVEFLEEHVKSLRKMHEKLFLDCKISCEN